MRITPLVVWTSALEKLEDVKKAISADVQLTHCNQLVHDAIFIYSISIHHLLKHPSKANRSQRAFELAIEQSQKALGHFEDPQTKESVFKWLCQAKLMSEQADQGQELIDPQTLSCLQKIGWIKWCFILSFYFLLRHQAYV